MARKKKKKRGKRGTFPKLKEKTEIPEKIRLTIIGAISIFLALFFLLSFFELAGIGGVWVFKIFSTLSGRTIFLFPLVFFLIGFAFFHPKIQKRRLIVLTSLIFLIAVSGIVSCFELHKGESIRFQFSERGGWIGSIISWPLLKIFGFWVTTILFIIISLVSLAVFWYYISLSYTERDKKEEKEAKDRRINIKKVFAPKFKVRGIEDSISTEPISKKGKKLKKVEKEDKRGEVVKIEKGAKLPPLDLLEEDKGGATSGDIQSNSQIIKRTLENFGIQVEMSEVHVGPTVTQYTLKPAEGIKLSKITTLNNNLSLALAAHPIRIEAPIPGKSLVGIEIPNQKRAIVRLRDMLSYPEFQNHSSRLYFSAGRDVVGKPVFADLARMPHLLVAGSTGTGKTIGLNSIIVSLLYKNTPKTLRLIMVDPKRVEFTAYNHLPHLLCPVIYDAAKTVNLLKWLVDEMERRFEILSEAGARNLASYNNKVEKNKKMEEEGFEYMPYIVLIVDELADLMAARGRDVEAGVVRLAQKARAVGIHLVLATQRPSVEVITGLIKANIIARMAFQVASHIDSRTILDSAGAEKLLGDGDMLFLSSAISKPRRLQGAYVSEEEVRKISEFIAHNQQIQGFDDLSHRLEEELDKKIEEGKGLIETNEDPLYEEAKKLVIETRQASASFLQRKLRVGYARAARLLDILENNGIIGPAKGAKPREVYGDMEALREEDEVEEKFENDYNEDID